jgi:hypothetical protein
MDNTMKIRPPPPLPGEIEVGVSPPPLDSGLRRNDGLEPEWDA